MGRKNVSREERNSCLYCVHLQKDKMKLGSLHGSRDTRFMYLTPLPTEQGDAPYNTLPPWDQKGWHGLASLNDSGPLTHAP